MNKIKIVGALIFVLSISLALLSSSISSSNQKNIEILNTINKQKAFTQEISKHIFYMYKNKTASSAFIDNIIREFVKNTDTTDKKLSKKTMLLWNQFYLKVQQFRDINKVETPYSNVLLQKLVNDIYTINLKLVMEFDKALKAQQKTFEQTQKYKKLLHYTLFFTLIILLIYLFTQLKDIMLFIQKFLKTSKKIIDNSKIKDIKPIEVQQNTQDILQATNNFNFLVQKVNDSIEYSAQSIEHSYRSVELIEKNVEELLELLYVMDEDKEFDKEMTKKEDILIQSLEELTTTAKKLQNLKKDLDSILK